MPRPAKNTPEPVLVDDASSTPATREDDRLVAEWIETCKDSFALKTELEQPKASRSYESQVKLVQATKAAGDKCNGLFRALRAHRKARRNSNPAGAPIKRLEL